MPQRDVCREVLGLDPEKLREIVPRLIAIYIAKLASRGDVEKAMAVAYEAYMKGYRSDYLDQLYEQIAALYGLNKLIAEAGEAAAEIGGPEATAKIRRARDKILGYIENNPVPETAKEYARTVAAALDKIADISDYLYAVSRKAGEAASILNNVKQTIESAHGIDELYSAFAKHGDVARAIELLDEALGTPAPDTAGLPQAYRDLVRETREQLRRTKEFAEALYTLTSHGIHIMAALDTLLNNLQNYGEGDNLLSNNSYRYALKSSITHILSHIRQIREELSRYHNGQVIAAIRNFTDAIIEQLNNLKQQLGKGDPRFVDIFEEAESEAGVNLVDVEKPMEAIPGLENFVRDVADTTRQYFRTGDALTKILAAIGIIGAGALDALSIILRPGAAMEQIKALQEMLNNTQKAINEKGLAGLGEAASKLFNNMFGTTENALYTTGGILAMIALSKAVGELPVPEKLRAVLVDALQADPIGLVISSTEALGVTNLLKQVLLRARGGRLVSKTLPRGFATAVRETLEKSLRRALGAEASILADRLTKVIARMLRKGVRIDEIRKTLTEMVQKHGLEKLVRDYRRLIDVQAGLENIRSFTRLAGRNMDIDILSDMAGNLRGAIKNLRKIISDYIDDIGRELGDKLLKQLDDIEKHFNDTLGMLDNIKDTLHRYLAGETTLDTLKAELGSALEKLGLTDIVKKLENATTQQDVIKLLPDIDAALIKKLAGAPAKTAAQLTDILGKIMKTKIGATMKAMHGHIIERVYIKLAENYASPALGKAFLETIKKLGLDAPAELIDKAKKGLLTIQDIEKYVDELAAAKPKTAAALETITIKKFMKTILENLENTDKTAATIIRSLGDRFLGEARIRGVPDIYTAVRMLAIDTAPSQLLDALKTLKHHLDELNPEYAHRLEQVINKFAEEAVAGKITEKTLKELFETVRKIPSIKGVKPSILAKIRYALMDYLDWLDTKNKYKPEATRVLKKMADIIATDLEALEKELLKKGRWGFFEYTVGETKIATPLIADKATLKKLYRLIGEPVKETTIKIGDNITVIGRRIAKLLPDGTLRIEYTLELPGKGKILKIAKTTRPLATLRQKLGQLIHGPRSEADLLTKRYELRAGTVYEVFYDPEALVLLRQSPEFAEQLFSGDVFRKIDPAFDILDKVFVVNIPTMTVGQLLLNVLRLAPWLAAAGLAVPVATMPQLLDYLSKLPRAEARELAKQGWIVLSGYELPSGEKIVVALPSSINLVRRIREYANLKTPYGTIRVPVVKLNEKQYYVITPIQVELPKLQYQQIEIPKQKTTPSPTPTPTTTGLPIGVGIPFGAPWLGLKTKKGKTVKKRQREKLMI